MPVLFARALLAHFRALCCLTAVGLASLIPATSRAQQGGGIFQYRWNGAPPADLVTPADIREALIWTGHLEAVFRGELGAAVRNATQTWQKSKGHAPTETLPTDQAVELVSQALKEREEVGWSVPRDGAVGIAFGVPTKLVTFATPRNEGAALWYYGGGGIAQSVGLHMGFPRCRSMDSVYQRLTARAAFRARQDNGFLALFHQGDRDSYMKWICHSAGLVSIETSAPIETVQTHRGLLTRSGGQPHAVEDARSDDPAAPKGRRPAVGAVRLLRRRNGASSTTDHPQLGPAIGRR